MSASSYVGAISSTNGLDINYPGGTVSNTYYLQGTATYGVSCSYLYTKTEEELKSSEMISLLGDYWIEDGKIKNENGEYVDNLDEDGNKIYINDGYPILKWQLERKSI